jgi:TPR repeat protein
MSGNDEKCPFCNAMTGGKTNNEIVGEIMKRVEANDAGSMMVLGNKYYHGQLDLNRGKALELYTRAAALGSSMAHFHLGNIYREGGDSKQAADLGSSKAHYNLGNMYHEGGDSKKSKFHYEAAAMAGHEDARYNLGCMESQSGNMGRAVKHWIIAASAGDYCAINSLILCFQGGLVREIQSTQL